MKRKHLFLFLAVFALLLQSKAQQANSKLETERLTKLMYRLEGTYQLQTENSRNKITFPLSALDTVEAKRKDDETVYFWINSSIRIMVLPRNEINKKDFKPISRIGALSDQGSK